MNSLVFIGAALAVGLAGVGVSIGEGKIARNSIRNLGVNPDLQGTFMVMTILGIALVESCAIYGLIIAFQILGIENLTWGSSLAAGLAVGLPGMVVGYAEGEIAAAAMDSILRNPEAKNKIMIMMILFIALIESCAIYGLIISFQILGK
jgi:F-type H+-transporting ATPase subunit c